MSRSGLIEFEVVIAIAHRKSFRVAASDLGMSTTAVSNAIANLEARLGVRLFHRSTRSVYLTQAGEHFVSQVEPAIATIKRAMSDASEQQSTPTGTIRLNSSLGAAMMIFEPLLQKFLNRYPGMAVDISTEGKMVDIISGGFDAGLRVSSRVPQDMIRIPIAPSVQTVVVGSLSYFLDRTKPVTPEDLSAHACIRARLPSGMPSPWEFVRAGKIFQMEVNGQLVMDAPLLMLEAVRKGAGLAQLPAWYVDTDLKEGKLVRILEDWSSPALGFSLYYPGRRHLPPGLRALISLIQEQGAQGI